MHEDHGAKIIPFPRDRARPGLPGDRWTSVGHAARDVTSSYFRRRAEADVASTSAGAVIRPLGPDERVALRVLARWSDDPATLERLARLDDAAGLGIGGDLQVSIGLRVATRALLVGRGLPRPTCPAEVDERRRLLNRHVHRDPVLVSMLLGRGSRAPRSL